MLGPYAAVLLLLVVSGVFLAVGLRAPARHLEDYLTARGTLTARTLAWTVFASGMGGWILFSPAESATWGGVAALVGYGLGAAAPVVAFVPLGRRMRELMPEGHSLTEYVYHRYGKAMYGVVLLTMVFYMAIYLTAEVTGMALAVRLVSGLPLWASAAIVLGTTLAYTAYGGLPASVRTDVVQTWLILPLFAVLVAGGVALLGGTAPLAVLRGKAPQLVSLTYAAGWETAVALVVAILAANLFHQGYWQRVYAARDPDELRGGLLGAAALSGPVVFLAGAFGLFAVALDRAQPASTALFGALLPAAPQALVVILLVLAVALCASTTDTLLNGLVSAFTVDLHRLWPHLPSGTLLRWARWATVLLGVPVFVVAAQGYSVLYLFLIADLVCAAAVVPTFLGLYHARLSGNAAALAAVLGMVAGFLFFPDPSFQRGRLSLAFLVALGVSTGVSVILASLGSPLDLTRLRSAVRPIEGRSER
ncbi:MAG: sodium:solute symporter [Armatimonadota bacterium]|nr:sodium:solute symporter [Armatimonadota bacterium]MDW8155136.1 sodium:solute symporter [Armatimonadota bacterium]